MTPHDPPLVPEGHAVIDGEVVALQDDGSDSHGWWRYFRVQWHNHPDYPRVAAEGVPE